MPPPLPFPHLSFPIDQVVSVASIDTMACDLHGSLLIGLGGSSVRISLPLTTDKTELEEMALCDTDSSFKTVSGNPL